MGNGQFMVEIVGEQLRKEEEEKAKEKEKERGVSAIPPTVELKY